MNIKEIYDSFSRGKQQLILRQELLPFLNTFQKVKEDKRKKLVYRLSEIKFDLNESEVAKLICFNETVGIDQKTIVAVPFAFVPAILLKRNDLVFDVHIISPLCLAERDEEQYIVASRVKVCCVSEKRRYTLDTNYKDFHDKDNSMRVGCTYTYPTESDFNVEELDS